ncbi:MAG TPA: YDG domain-containing protein, partial [Gemmatales bacterium]|nr:YDG domain-containing protein [Gemmatales bacterium]
SGNYTLDQPAGLTADITAKTAIASLVGVISKTFDGSTQANVAQANYTLNGILLADSVTLNFPAIGNYATPDVGTGKLVSVMGLALLGSDALNYTLSATSISGSIGRIDPAPGPITTTDGSYADVPRLIFSNDRVINLRSSNSTVQTEQQAMHSGQSNGTLTPHELSPSSSSYKRPPRRIPYITVTPELQRELGLPQEL